MEHEGKLRIAPESRMAKEARAPPGGPGSTGGQEQGKQYGNRRDLREETRGTGMSGSDARRGAGMTDSHLTDGTKESRTIAEASPGGIRSNQADRVPRLREALSSSGRRM